MKKKTKMQNIMVAAHKYRRTYGGNMSEALKSSWARYKFNQAVRAKAKLTGDFQGAYREVYKHFPGIEHQAEKYGVKKIDMLMIEGRLSEALEMVA